MATVLHPLNVVATDPNVRNGRPCIAGTSIEVAVIAIQKIVHEQTPEEIAVDYRLLLPQVYGARAYYYEHKHEMDETMNVRRQIAQSYKEKRVGSRA